MAKNDNLKDFVTDLADAIREKKGTTDLINPQDFSDEIKNLPSGSSPFAVDFGEEIATGNPTFINALQEDIDYYNEVQKKRAAGEVTDEELLNDWRFKARIAWYPKGMDKPNVIEGFRNLKFLCIGEDDTNVTKIGLYNNIDNLVIGYRSSLYGFFDLENVIYKISLSDDMLGFTNVLIYYALNNIVGLHEIDYKFVPINNATSIANNKWLQVIKGINMHNVTQAPSGNNTQTNLRYIEIKGLGVSFALSNANLLEIDSVKYILDHCQEKTESYTLTLHADVKTAFLAKCDEDAEYAASLAAANAKGLSIA